MRRTIILAALALSLTACEDKNILSDYARYRSAVVIRGNTFHYTNGPKFSVIDGPVIVGPNGMIIKLPAGTTIYSLVTSICHVKAEGSARGE